MEAVGREACQVIYLDQPRYLRIEHTRARGSDEDRLYVEEMAEPREVLVSARYRTKWRDIAVRFRGGVRVQRIQIRYRVLSDDTVRWFFICPVTGFRVLRLYIVDGSLASAAGHALGRRARTIRIAAPKTQEDVAQRRHDQLLGVVFGCPGRAPAKGDERRHAIEALRANDFRDELSEELLIEAQENAPSYYYRRFHVASPFDPLSTDAGLCGAADLDEDEGADLASFIEEVRAGIPSPEWEMPELWTERAVFHQQPRLETRTLGKAGLFGGAVKGLMLAWKDRRGVVARFAVVTDLRVPGRQTLWARAYQQTGEITQPIPLVMKRAGNGVTWSMLCPIEGEYTQAMAWRVNRFASAKGQNLIPRGQWDGRMPGIFEAT